MQTIQKKRNKSNFSHSKQRTGSEAQQYWARAKLVQAILSYAIENNKKIIYILYIFFIYSLYKREYIEKNIKLFSLFYSLKFLSLMQTWRLKLTIDKPGTYVLNSSEFSFTHSLTEKKFSFTHSLTEKNSRSPIVWHCRMSRSPIVWRNFNRLRRKICPR